MSKPSCSAVPAAVANSAAGAGTKSNKEKETDLYYEFCKSLVKSADDELAIKLRGESTTSKMTQAAVTALFGGVGVLMGQPGIGRQAGAVNSVVKKWDEGAQENKRLTLYHAVGSKDTTTFQKIYRKIMIRAAIEIWHSYENQLNHVYRQVASSSTFWDCCKEPPADDCESVKNLNSLQAIQKLANFAGSCCVSHMIKMKNSEDPHRGVLGLSLLGENTSAMYKQVTVDKIRFKWQEGGRSKKISVAQFYDYPITAFFVPSTSTSSSQSLEDKKLLELRTEDLKRISRVKVQRLRRPFNFEAVDKSQDKLVTMVMEVEEVEKLDYFVWTDRTADVDKIYGRLMEDRDFDRDDAMFAKFEKIVLLLKNAEEFWEKKFDTILTNLNHDLPQKIVQVLNEDKEKEQKPIFFRVTDPTHSFSGRKEIVEKIHNSLQNGVGNLTILCGLGGVGKTETVRKYVQNYHNCYTNIVWINGSSRLAMETSFSDLAHGHLGINVRDEKMSLIVQKVYEKICIQSTLLIFDNVEQNFGDKDEEMVDFLPHKLPPTLKMPFLLATSRFQDWDADDDEDAKTTVVKLPLFQVEETMELLQKKLKIQPIDPAHAQQLGNLLGYLPLSLQQAVAYILEQNKLAEFNQKGVFTIEDYIRKFKEGRHTLKLLKHGARDTKSTVYHTLTLTLDTIRGLEHGKVAMRIIEILSLFNPDHVPLPFLMAALTNATEGEDCECDDDEIGQGLLLLKNYAVVDTSNGSKLEGNLKYLTTHRLVQHIVVDKMKECGQLEKILCGLLEPCQNFLETLTPSNPFYNEVLKNLATMIQHLSLLVSKDGLDFEENVAFKMKDIGWYSQSMEILENVYQKRVKMMGTEDQSSLQSLHNIGLVLSSQGKYGEALEQFQKVYDLQEKFLGLQDLSSLASLYNIGFVLAHQGKYEEAIQTYVKVYDSQEKILGPEHPVTLAILNSIGSALDGQGKYEEALEKFQKVFQLRQKILGPHHLSTLTTRHDMATISHKQGKYSQAFEMYEKVFEIQEKILGPEHPSTLTTLNNLAYVLSKQGKYDEAFEIYQKVYDTEIKILGPEHPETLKGLHNMGLTLYQKGKYDAALQTYDQVYKIQEKILGTEHPATCTTLHNMALVLANQEKYEEALQKYKKVYTIQEKILGKDHPDNLSTVNNMAFVLDNQKKYDEALQKFQYVYDLRVKILGKEHPATLISLNNIASVLDNQGKTCEALEKYGEVSELQKKVLGPEHPTTLNSLHNMAFVLNTQKKFDSALKLFEQVYDSREKILGSEHPDTLATLFSLAFVLFNSGRLNEALDKLKVVLVLREKVFGKEHALTMTVRDKIAFILWKQGNQDEALQEYRHIYDIQVKNLGKESPSTVQTLQSIESILAQQNNEL